MTTNITAIWTINAAEDVALLFFRLNTHPVVKGCITVQRKRQTSSWGNCRDLQDILFWRDIAEYARLSLVPVCNSIRGNLIDVLLLLHILEMQPVTSEFRAWEPPQRPVLDCISSYLILNAINRLEHKPSRRVLAVRNDTINLKKWSCQFYTQSMILHNLLSGACPEQVG